MKKTMATLAHSIPTTLLPAVSARALYSTQLVVFHLISLDPKNPATNEHSHMDGTHDPDQALRKIRNAGSISISPELFEKIYLSPQNNVKGDLRGTFANPTPLVWHAPQQDPLDTRPNC